MTRVLVKFLASVKDKVGKGAEEHELADGSTLSELAIRIQKSHQLSLLDPAIMVTLNGRGIRQLPEGLETRLGDGDVILLFPFISGG
ncbi:MAG: MoaD/ThiS family protein [Anaerolineales bacterium]|nr:MoaD/ThiS family protein [Anaerolineales bacterium]